MTSWCSLFFFFTAPATTEIYTLSLHDALPISRRPGCQHAPDHRPVPPGLAGPGGNALAGEPAGQAGDGSAVVGVAAEHLRYQDRKSTRLNSSHSSISYAVFCLKKKKKTRIYDK